ncbi:hypothetical protein LGL55_11685 [Clostridium tagluense]|uniref:hypothetical protein n=1 Tax=Clostridium tagluense TaxID=360422 RepID=UPI001C0C44FE|nr:hypothetical protein [Clostridium tagluense]MBU3127188.1 hypothetical protein [Clostridium tagluense]MCB2312052.1 hypothetical protein [Clostridium tagluense]MCB2316639.1 hypothetical protein [Clostridium tagluense]MCB2321425.1 hypothetical protein [Clostridium tagluense]MCB2326437.1 hypothetical protein [Clostridium tagluense]
MKRSRNYLCSTIIIISTFMTINVFAQGVNVNNNTSITTDKVTLNNKIIVKDVDGDIDIQLNKSKQGGYKFIQLQKHNDKWGISIKKENNSNNGNHLSLDLNFGFTTEDRSNISDPVYNQNTYADTDTDGDGLTDYQEIHKYFSNPYNRDTDGDGIPDGDLNERTENTYVIKTTMRINKPYNINVMKNDNYQDVTLKGETSEYGIFDIVLYPYNTNNVDSNYNWKDYAKSSELQQYLKPTITANWDNQLRTTIISDLKYQGIDIENSMYNGVKVADTQIVEKVTNYIYNNTQSLKESTNFYTSFSNGIPTIAPELQAAFQRDKGNQSWSTQEQFNHELYGKQMYMNKQHGSSESSAILMETVFRAIGIPCRIIQTVPIIDCNDPIQQALLNNISDADIRGKVRQGTAGMVGFSSPTYNEIYVGNRWVRLNYDKINQNIFDEKNSDSMIHLNTINDLSDTDLTVWGRRYALQLRDTFKYDNPYETTNITSVNGIHSKLNIR